MPTNIDGHDEAPSRGAEVGDGGRTLRSRRHYDPAAERSLTAVVVFAVADALDVDAVDVRSPVLYDVVDLTAVESTLFGASGEGDGRASHAAVSFRFADTHVVVRDDGWVQVYEPATEDDPTTDESTGVDETGASSDEDGAAER